VITHLKDDFDFCVFETQIQGLFSTPCSFGLCTSEDEGRMDEGQILEAPQLCPCSLMDLIFKNSIRDFPRWQLEGGSRKCAS
jgi:hypothetical protein